MSTVSEFYLGTLPYQGGGGGRGRPMPGRYVVDYSAILVGKESGREGGVLIRHFTFIGRLVGWVKGGEGRAKRPTT